MTRSWKVFLALLASSSMLAATCSIPAFAQQDVPDAPAAANADADDADDADEEEDIEFDESEADDEEEDVSVNDQLEKVVEAELGDSANSNSPEELVNLATEIKLTATTLLDLTKVVSLCNKAEKLGLDEDNLEFARQLRLSAQLDRGLAIAQLFLDPDMEIAQLPNGWEALRDNAIADLNVAVKDNPEIAVAQLSLGRLYMLADKDDLAKAAYDAAIDGVDDSGEIEVKTLAYMYRAMMETDAVTAIPYMEKAIELCPEDEPRLYAQYSDYLLQSNRIDDAMKQLDKAIELAPDNIDYKKGKANLLAKVHREDEARALFDEATKDAPDNLMLQIDKAQFLATINDYEGALALYSNLARKYDGPGLYFLRGAVYAQMKNYEKALADANQALRRDSNLLPALRLKGIVYTQMEKYDDAIRAFEQLRRKSKDDAGRLEATTQIAFVVSKQGYYKRASGMLKKELEKDPKNADLLRSLADMELLYGHWGEARRLYDQLLEIAPSDSGVLNNYSWLLSTCPDEQYRDAARALEYGKKAAEETLYAAPHILSTLASAYAESGDFDAAREWAQKAVELGEKEDHDSLDSLRKELESYKENKPWRETSDIMTEIEEESVDAPADDAENKPAEEQPAEEQPAEAAN